MADKNLTDFLGAWAKRTKAEIVNTFYKEPTLTWGRGIETHDKHTGSLPFGPGIGPLHAFPSYGVPTGILPFTYEHDMPPVYFTLTLIPTTTVHSTKVLKGSLTNLGLQNLTSTSGELKFRYNPNYTISGDLNDERVGAAHISLVFPTGKIYKAKTFECDVAIQENIRA